MNWTKCVLKIVDQLRTVIALVVQDKTVGSARKGWWRLWVRVCVRQRINLSACVSVRIVAISSQKVENVCEINLYLVATGNWQPIDTELETTKSRWRKKPTGIVFRVSKIPKWRSLVSWEIIWPTKIIIVLIKCLLVQQKNVFDN